MMGRQTDNQQSLFYDFCLEDHVPTLAGVSSATQCPDLRMP